MRTAAFPAELALRRALAALARWLPPREHPVPAGPLRSAEPFLAEVTAVERIWRIPPYMDCQAWQGRTWRDRWQRAL